MKNLYIPPALIAYSILVMILLYSFIGQYNFILFPFNLIGLGFAFFGFMLMGKARELFNKHQTTLKIERSTHLIKDGVFSRTRNPMYVGMFFLVFGFSVISTNLIALLLPFVFILLVRMIFISKEESLMNEAFGKEYLEYRKTVRRWF
ncbi:MAG: isoprenylcysteine carboxylmethyltransferase family protein [Bacteroidales bacterium]|nr:isoprenylcysteine carboxylmethyltransferase family protein [Bacteroidales bacterium]